MNCHRLCLTFGLLLLMSAAPTDGVLVPILDLDKLTEEATLIVVAKIASTEEVGKTAIQFGSRAVPARVMVAALSVDQFLKSPDGFSSSSLRFHFVLPDEFIGWHSPLAQDYRIFFLSERSGQVELANSYYPSTVAIPGATVREGTAIDRVIQVLGAVLESSRGSEEQKLEAVFALRHTKNLASIEALKRPSQIRDIALRLSVAAALLGHNDISTLPFAEDALLRPDTTLRDPYLLQNLSASIRSVKDERAVMSLARLLHGPMVETRRAATEALMHIGSTSCIDPLLSATEDSDRDVRYYAVVGLAETTGQLEWRPNMDDFTSDPQKYLQHWLEWSRARGQQKK